jgi:hypothetical protein
VLISYRNISENLRPFAITRDFIRGKEVSKDRLGKLISESSREIPDPDSVVAGNFVWNPDS